MKKYWVMIGAHAYPDSVGTKFPSMKEYLRYIDAHRELDTYEDVVECYEENVEIGEYHGSLEQWFKNEVIYVGEFEPDSWWD